MAETEGIKATGDTVDAANAIASFAAKRTPPVRRKVEDVRTRRRLGRTQGNSGERRRASSRGTAREYFLERGRSGQGIEELWKDLGAAGLLGVHLPEEYGGGGGGMAEAVVVVEELAAHGMPMLIWVISPAICGNILAHHGSEAMKREWLPDLADGSRKMAFGLTEPDAGSNSHNGRHHRAAHRGGLDDLRVEVLHLGRRSGRRHPLGGQGRRTLHAGEERAVAVRGSHQQLRAFSSRRSRPRSSRRTVNSPCSSTTSRSVTTR